MNQGTGGRANELYRPILEEMDTPKVTENLDENIDVATDTREELNSEFRKDLQSLLNTQCMESGSNTPDFVLAEYLKDSLLAFDKAVNQREEYYYGQPISDNTRTT